MNLGIKKKDGSFCEKIPKKRTGSTYEYAHCKALTEEDLSFCKLRSISATKELKEGMKDACFLKVAAEIAKVNSTITFFSFILPR